MLKTLLVAGVAVSLSLLGACGKEGDPAATASPSPSASAGSPSASASPSKAAVKASDSLDAIKVTGAYGKSPKVTVKAPFAIDKTRTTVLSKGDGPTIKEGSTVTVDYYGVDARTGKKFDDSFSRGAPATFSLAQVVPGFSKGLTGQKQGSRVLIGMPGTDGYDASGGNAQAGIEVGDTLLFVVDIVAVPLDGPEGTAVEPKAGLPKVTDKDGVPEITIPKTDPPAKLVAQPIIKGKGAKVAESDTITFNYRWYTWDGKLVEESYKDKPAEYQLAGLLPGMAKGLKGQTVGSRVLLVIPPADGYPDGNATPKIEKGTTLVMVVDLLFAAEGQAQ
ncbi:MAG: FKBP-type peptidyl-prolyl cis-trans isomerase [Microlunatus sp.]